LAIARSNPRRSSFFSGLLLFVAGSQFFLLLFVSTALYPNYNVNFNYISDLGETCRAGVGCKFFEPSSMIFNLASFLLGLLVIIGFALLLRESKRSIYSYLGLASGIGAMGVGLFPEGTGHIHGSFALLAFVGGGLAAIAAFPQLKLPFNVLSIILGLMSLSFLGLFISLTLGNLTSSTHATIAGLGIGGLERLIVYPVVLWLVGFGGYLMNKLRTRSIQNPKVS
jgi:hypothetical membrane protein